THIGPRPEDKDVLVSDYPLLPVRRRFWEHALRAVDVGGTTVQLRNQLRVVYEAVRSTAADPLGTEIPADFLYFQLAPTLLQTSVLPREVHELVGRLQQSPEPDAPLKARLVALVFLIGKLPPRGAPSLRVTMITPGRLARPVRGGPVGGDSARRPQGTVGEFAEGYAAHGG
ncbi:MAG TPA: hypothetical protein PKA64_17915, partial [Myxococcota bacterium]|nr:hypothetical protein [Myxococcota bacterium]